MTYYKRSVHHHLGFEKREMKEGETDVIGLKFVMNGLTVRFIPSMQFFSVVCC